MNIKKKIVAILDGENVTPKTALQRAAAAAMKKGGGTEPFTVNAVLGVDGEGKDAILLDITAAELYAAVSAGRTVIVCLAYKVHDGQPDEHTVNISMISNIEVQKLEAGFATGYTCIYITYSDDGIESYKGDTLEADDPVVLTKQE